ncbi:type II toxin-antitoxin system VapC family toxin [Neorhizobium sp. CSC1952]|uniref:type II toxin-antitoxin system VapC family toxin n=1 Tax=Neorhizobium sp. CSC1952 TaxID=2978974 RepID=UPI0025A63207|nr:type II toxin-antitoxin system VapC family toxin [Rhizobium sp. CSC1952]WJR66032.1 type II toxin-antitoxin system VapC family toxin [Rhizobium sp. CSC1952]
MRLLLDTHFVLAGVNREMAERYPLIERLIAESLTESFVSVASLWEIAIKSRLGKLETRIPVEDIPSYLASAGFTILHIDIPHVITAAEPEPETRDPFDRLLLAQCQAEGLLLVTIDRALTGHRLAFKF